MLKPRKFHYKIVSAIDVKDFERFVQAAIDAGAVITGSPYATFEYRWDTYGQLQRYSVHNQAVWEPVKEE